jgi:hypothetical protein
VYSLSEWAAVIDHILITIADDRAETPDYVSCLAVAYAILSRKVLLQLKTNMDIVNFFENGWNNNKYALLRYEQKHGTLKGDVVRVAEKGGRLVDVHDLLYKVLSIKPNIVIMNKITIIH